MRKLNKSTLKYRIIPFTRSISHYFKRKLDVSISKLSFHTPIKVNQRIKSKLIESLMQFSLNPIFAANLAHLFAIMSQSKNEWSRFNSYKITSKISACGPHKNTMKSESFPTKQKQILIKKQKTKLNQILVGFHSFVTKIIANHNKKRKKYEKIE